MPVSVNVQTVHPRTLAAVRREVAPDAARSAWGPALAQVWDSSTAGPDYGLTATTPFYHHPEQPGARITRDFGVEVTLAFATTGEV